MAVTSPPIRLLLVPYDSGRREERMGAGPLALRRAGAAHTLRVEATSHWRAELATGFELQRLAAAEVADARTAGWAWCGSTRTATTTRPSSLRRISPAVRPRSAAPGGTGARYHSPEE